MALLSSTWILDIAFILLGILIATFLYAVRHFQYWKKKGVPHKSPIPFVGNLLEVVTSKHSLGSFLAKEYLDNEGQRFTGIYAFDSPLLVVRDLELVKAITVKDFHHFVDRNFAPSDSEPISSRSLFAITGHRWKNLRIHLTPTFTSGKMKRMFHLVDACAKELVIYLEKPAKLGETAEIKEICSRFTTDVIASCAFGMEINSLKDPDSEFRMYLKKLFVFDLVKSLKFAMAFFSPHISALLKLQMIEADVKEYVRSIIWNTVKYREENGIVRNDFLDLLMKLRKDGRLENDDDDSSSVNIEKSTENGWHETMQNEKVKNGNVNKLEMNNGTKGNEETDNKGNKIDLEGDDFVAQAFIFLTAGFETSSTTMSFALYELAKHPDCQKLLRKEIITAINENGGEITYSLIMSLKYLDQVVNETLRLYPVLPFLDRKVVQDYKIPGADIVLEKGVAVLIPVLGIHTDPKIFPKPELFDPERFSDQNKRNIPKYSYLPFGEGPRNCIGNRMGLMQVKVGLARILYAYEVSPGKDTPIPIKIDPKSLTMTAEGGIPLLFKKTSKI